MGIKMFSFKTQQQSKKLLHFDSCDDQLIQDSYQQVLTFTDGLQLTSTLTTADIISALQAAHTAADEYYTVRMQRYFETVVMILLQCVVINKAN